VSDTEDRPVPTGKLSPPRRIWSSSYRRVLPDWALTPFQLEQRKKRKAKNLLIAARRRSATAKKRRKEAEKAAKLAKRGPEPLPLVTYPSAIL